MGHFDLNKTYRLSSVGSITVSCLNKNFERGIELSVRVGDSNTVVCRITLFPDVVSFCQKIAHCHATAKTIIHRSLFFCQYAVILQDELSWMQSFNQSCILGWRICRSKPKTSLESISLLTPPPWCILKHAAFCAFLVNPPAWKKSCPLTCSPFSFFMFMVWWVRVTRAQSFFSPASFTVTKAVVCGEVQQWKHWANFNDDGLLGKYKWSSWGQRMDKNNSKAFKHKMSHDHR